VSYSATFVGLAVLEGHEGRQKTPVVDTEYQSRPSAVLSRATMRAQRGSSATDGAADFGGFWDVTVIVFGPHVAWAQETDNRLQAHSAPCFQIGLACGLRGRPGESRAPAVEKRI
jgi:hypothetical protein